MPEIIARKTRAQSAVEYLTTYGWAIIIIAIVLAALYEIGLFNPSGFVSTTCTFPAEFGCLTAVLSSSSATTNAIMNVTIQQSTQSVINITAYGCNNLGTPTNMILPNNPPSDVISLAIGGTNSLSITCYNNYSLLTINPGQLFKGYVIINYTNVQTGFPHTVVGTVIAKAV